MNVHRSFAISFLSVCLAGTSRDSILAAWREHTASPKQGRVPRFWDGQAARRCRQAIRRFFGMSSGK